MLKTVGRGFTALVLLTGAYGAFAQPLLTPTPPPAVTAESEPWFQSRSPLVFAGRLYYPAGAQVHFNGNEMVRSGYYGSVPVYTRTTIEPYSVLYVPLAGGVMQPYERRRSGDLAGTAGSTVSSFPIDTPTSRPADPEQPILQAQGPPTGLRTFDREARAVDVDVPPTRPPDRPVATSGTARPMESPAPAERLGSLTSARKPEGLNGIFVTFQNRRWFSAGPAVTFDPSRFTQAGRYDGLPIYVDRSTPNTIYVPVAASADALVAPYSLDRRPPLRD